MATRSFSAFLWDGLQRLPGALILGDVELVFEVEAFSDAGLNVRIPYASIRKVELLLIFDLGLNGLLIEDAEGRRNCFVLDEPVAFKKALKNLINKNHNNLP
jgi:hypothetical protein